MSAKKNINQSLSRLADTVTEVNRAMMAPEPDYKAVELLMRQVRQCAADIEHGIFQINIGKLIKENYPHIG